MAAGGALGGLRAATSVGSAASTAYQLGQETSGSSSVRAGLGGVASAAGHAVRDSLGKAGGLAAAADRGERAALMAGGRTSSSAGPVPSNEAAPRWAQQLRSEQTSRHRRHLALAAIRDGDRGSAGALPDISEKEE